MPNRKRKRSDSPTFSRRCSVHWFRKGLRLHDNPSFLEGLKGAAEFRCVYILDPWFAGSYDNTGINRWRFLLQCLEDLDSNLKKLNSRLFVIRGQPSDVFPKIFKEWKVNRLSFEVDSEPFARKRDQAIRTMATEANVEVISCISHTLYDPLEILTLNDNEPPLTYKRFQTLISGMDPPPHPCPAPTTEQLEGIERGIELDHYEKYGVPTLEELGFDTDNIPPVCWQGGETEAKKRLDRHLERKAWIANFESPKMTPVSLMASQTGLTPYLRFGCLSSRLFYWKLSELFMMVRKTKTVPLSLQGQLLWREFFYTVACNNPNFDCMMGNQICVKIPWDKNKQALDKWARAKTGFPWIDAIMTQLRQEGWIHSIARHAVGCFLTRGDLWVSWEEGMKVFEELLLDADWSINAGNWIWLSCSSFFQQFFHVYCPVTFGKRTDPSGDYVRKYLPVLKHFPTKYIYAPWEAPTEVQIQAKCIVGKDYPFPMVDHEEASRLNIERMKQVYSQLSHYAGPSLLAAIPSSKDSNDGKPPRMGLKSIIQHTSMHSQMTTVGTQRSSNHLHSSGMISSVPSRTSEHRRQHGALQSISSTNVQPQEHKIAYANPSTSCHQLQTYDNPSTSGHQLQTMQNVTDQSGLTKYTRTFPLVLEFS
ncbi:cryptochrome-1-like [Anneissia japonica]|uniref:cryptochrome-1-like n=1 Tax=Anneissia japonica TaxID=1529436 RepID=UPI001425B3BC|nr:cryptochrome-1-like [Anneissia japonica]XP_033101803.1 cryptochrome-1-like [Anneissia japonica]